MARGIVHSEVQGPMLLELDGAQEAPVPALALTQTVRVPATPDPRHGANGAAVLMLGEAGGADTQAHTHPSPKLTPFSAPVDGGSTQ